MIRTSEDEMQQHVLRQCTKATTPHSHRLILLRVVAALETLRALPNEDPAMPTALQNLITSLVQAAWLQGKVLTRGPSKNVVSIFGLALFCLACFGAVWHSQLTCASLVLKAVGGALLYLCFRSSGLTWSLNWSRGLVHFTIQPAHCRAGGTPMQFGQGLMPLRIVVGRMTRKSLLQADKTFMAR